MGSYTYTFFSTSVVSSVITSSDPDMEFSGVRPLGGGISYNVCTVLSLDISVYVSSVLLSFVEVLPSST